MVCGMCPLICWCEISFTSLLVPIHVGRLGTNIYVVTVETSQPVEARYASCTQLLWKPRDQGRQGTTICVVTVETSRRWQTRHAHLHSYRTNLN